MKRWVVLLLLAAVSPELRYFRYERLVISTLSEQSQTCVVLDAPVFAHAAPMLSDLRLYRAGVETPYAIRFAGPAESGIKSIAPLNPGRQDGHVVFDAAMPEGSYSEIVLDIEAHDFIASVDVFGSQSQTNEKPTKIGSYTIFDFTSQRLGRSMVLHLPESDFRYLHFRIDGPLKPEDVNGLHVARVAESTQEYITVAETSQFIQKKGETQAEFALSANVPVDRVDFVADSQPVNFSREATVTTTYQKPAPGGDVESTPSTSSGSILRIHGIHNGRRIDEERLGFDVTRGTENVDTKWVVRIDNGDDPPLTLRSVRLEMRERSLCFDAARGARYNLYYGDAALSAPRYDYATLFTPERGAARAELGPELNNPDYRPRPDERPFTEKHPGLLWVALALVVLLLGGIALRSARRLSSQ